MKKISDFLGNIPMTMIGGIFLVLSLLLPALNIYLPLDPAWISVMICGIPLLYLSIWRLIYNKGISKISSALLISIAMVAAIAIGDLFAAGEVAFIMAIGAILEDKTTERAKKGLKTLISLAPQQGRKIKNGSEIIIKVDEIKKGDLLRVLPGETIPVDGIITVGNTSIDQSIMTGESLPVDKEVGDSVFCGTLNCFGSIDMKATKVGEDSSLQKLIHMVEEAENKKAPMARIADTCASWLVPVALLIAILAYFVTGNIVRAVTVLVVFCPCALVLATPTAIMAAIGQATKRGVIIKSGEALEKMGKVDTITFDKTGTLTFGSLEVNDILSFSDKYDNHTLLSLIASAETRSEHPLGKAIVAYAKDQNITLIETTNFQMEAGKGIYAEINNKKIFCGNEKYLKEKRIFISKHLKEVLDKFRNEGKASILASVNDECVGMITLSDILRPTAQNMITQLKNMGTDIILLTGDNQKTAEYFAKQVNITNIKSELLPAEKVKNIQKLQKEEKYVCMIGDGVNDAPALKTANVGVAMGSMGSDIAIEAADIALMSDDITKIPYLKRLSNATVKTIKFSIALSLLINFVAITLSLLGMLTPTTGALVHNAGSVFVVLIAALLYDRKFE
ncbi:MAG TPA: cation-translocating P-type ATPase [Candidatus Fimimorpha faecalis]|uniref:Cd(2+)-exporting ATPase n=1 Tax=Candidatus Fimimorpha faecalis TaxID=2840824 RepID=A0A9D1EDY0_9FIRM|nr:cation-translocating P-type ATPase [Candidatus Fimimorpha faecalis]